MPALELENVHKSYGKHQVLKGVNLSVEKGEIFGLLGPNGAGKTTLFQTVIGMLRHDKGAIKINDRPNNIGKEVKKEIGYLPSDINFYEDMDSVENLEFFAQLAETDPDIEQLLELVGLQDDKHRNVGEYSTGMKKRLGVAQALVKDPEIAIFDEPTTGLDPEGKNKFRHHIEKINEEKDMTIIISSHITTEISSLCDRFGILTEGVIKASGTKEELSDKVDSSNRTSVTVDSPEKAQEIFEEAEIDYSREGRKFLLETGEEQRMLDILYEEGVKIKSFESEEASLEAAYLNLTR